MRLIVLTALACLTLIQVTACGKSTGHTRPDGGSATYVLTVPGAEAPKVALTARLTCDLGGSVCPPALAMFVSNTPVNGKVMFGQCTSFLVAPNLMMTNAHCLPTSLRASGVSCRERIKFYFGPSSTGESDVADCESVVSASAIDENKNSRAFVQKPDYAFLRLTRPVRRKPLELSREGLADAVSYRVLAIDPANEGRTLGGILRLKRCEIAQGSLINPRTPGDFANVMSASCRIVHGNSGSPVMDDDVRVRGLVQGMLSPASLAADAAKGMDLPKSFNEMGIISNMACVAAPLDLMSPATPDACRAPLLSSGEFVRSSLSEASPDLQKSFTAWRMRAPTIFKFELRQTTSGQTVGYPEAVCVYPSAQWISRAGDAASLGLNSISVTGQTVALSFKTPFWGSRAALDPAYRLSIRTKSIDIGVTTFNLDFTNADARGVVRADYKTQGKTARASSPAFDLPICGT